MDDGSGAGHEIAVLAQVNLATQHQFATQTFAHASRLWRGAAAQELSTKQVQQRQGIRLDSIQKSVAAIAGRTENRPSSDITNP